MMSTLHDAPLLYSYVNGGTQVSLHADGTKVREVMDAHVPPVLQEQMDLKITNWCDAGCQWCHEGSTRKGRHGDLKTTLALLSGLNPGTEVAIGGGDPLSHPDFAWFVRELRGFGVVPSVTVNGKHLARHRPVLEKLIQEGALFGVGVSFHDEIPDWDYEHMVLHMIAGIHDPKVLDDTQRSLKILLLGYKTFGRGKKLFELRTASVQAKISQWYRELFMVARNHHVSFDNLAIEQLKPQRLFADQSVFSRQYMGQEGEYSMYIDAVEQTFALSSYSPQRHAWQEFSDMAEMFAKVRSGQGLSVAQK